MPMHMIKTVDLVAARDGVISEQDWRDPVGLCGAAEVLSIGSVPSATSIGCPYGGGIYRKAVKVAPEQFEQYQWRGRTIEYHRAQIRKLHGFRKTTVDDPTGIAQTTVAIARAFGKPPGVDAAHLQPRHALWEVPPGHDRAIGN
jgi:hypothetical protein